MVSDACIYMKIKWYIYNIYIFAISKFFYTLFSFYPFYSEKAMASHSSTLAWKIPWTEEAGGLQSMGSLRVGHNWTTSLSLTYIGGGSGNPLQCSCLENPRDGGAWWAAIYGVAQSRTRLKRLSSSKLLNSSSSMVVLPDPKHSSPKIFDQW